MSDRIIKVKNNTQADITIQGVLIEPNEYYQIESSELNQWQSDDLFFSYVGDGTVVINTGIDTVNDITDKTLAWKWVLGDTMPRSEVGDKLWVHQSSKPQFPDKIYTTVWTGAGDDILNGEIGDGDPIIFDIKDTDGTVLTKDINFGIGPLGEVWLHEGLFMWHNAPWGANVTVNAVCKGTPLQQVAQLDLIIDGTAIKYSPSGPGTGTHGFVAADQVYVASAMRKDGAWDLDGGGNLVPNFTNTGKYQIQTEDFVFSRFINKVPLFSSATQFNCLESSDSAQLHNGHKLQVVVNTDGITEWKLWLIMCIHRDLTV